MVCPYGEPPTKIALDKLHFAKGLNFSLHYDFGDDWMFTIHVQKIEEEEQKKPPSYSRQKVISKNVELTGETVIESVQLNEYNKGSGGVR